MYVLWCVCDRAQVAEERLLGLTPALHMDAKDERVQCQLEINFIDCVVTPLWEHCAHCFPALHPCMERVRANRAAYSALATCSNEEVAQVGLVVCSSAMMQNVGLLLQNSGHFCAICGITLLKCTQRVGRFSIEQGQQSDPCCSS